MASNELEVLDPAATVEKPQETVSGVEVNRRHFMTALGAAGVVAGAALVSAPAARALPAPPLTGFLPTDVLNFLLNIKYLKATLYSFIATGTDLPANYTVNGVTYQPILGTNQMYNAPTKVGFTGTNAAQLTDMFNEMFYDELNQLVSLQNLLGSAAIARPLMDLSGNSAASTSTSSVNFSTSTSATETLSGVQALSYAQYLEDLSVTAVANALSYFSGTTASSLSSSSGAELALLAEILATDGCHAGAVRLAYIQNGASQSNYHYTGTASFSLTAGAAGGSNIIYGFLSTTSPIQVGYTVSTSATIATAADANASSGPGSTAYVGYTSVPGISGFATVTAVGAVPSSYATKYTTGGHATPITPGVNGTTAHHGSIITDVFATDALSWAVGMPVSGGDMPNSTTGPGTFITAIAPDTTGNGTYNVTLSASSGGHTSGALSIGTTPITLSAPFPALGSFTLSTLGFISADPADVFPADIGAGVATTGPTFNPPGVPANPLYQGFFDTAGSTDATTQTSAGLAFARTFSQVLAVLYNSTAVTTYRGGFFPEAVGGSINTVQPATTG